MSRRPVLLGADGLPLVRTDDAAVAKAAPAFFHDEAPGFFLGRFGTGATRSFGQHAWLTAAACAIATAASQAPFKVWHESQDAIAFRRTTYEKATGRIWTAAHGRRRRAVLRHIMAQPSDRARMKGVDELLEHPLMDVLARPNPYQSGFAFFLYTYLYLAAQRECFWVLDSGDTVESPGAGRLPDRIWPFGPQCMEPILADGATGPIVAWRFTPPRYTALANRGAWIDLDASQVIHFKFPNPGSLITGLSNQEMLRTTVESDVLAQRLMKATLESGGETSGVLQYDSRLSPEDRDAKAEQWRSRYGRGEGRARTVILDAGWKWQSTALSPDDLTLTDVRAQNRDEILGVFGVPKVVLGMAEDYNYASSQTARQVFWEGPVISLIRLVEAEIDSTLFATEPDTIFGAHDLRNVDALRAGLTEKIQNATLLSGDALHVPPKTAFEVVGLEVPEYEEDDTAFVSPALMPAEMIEESAQLTQSQPTGEPFGGQGGMPEAMPSEMPATGEPLSSDYEAENAGAVTESYELAVHRLERLKANRWRAFLAAQQQVEAMFARGYRSWVTIERDEVLKRFDAASSKAGLVVRMPINTTLVLRPIEAMISALKKLTRSIYSKVLEITFGITVEDVGGIPTFSVDDPAIQKALDDRQAFFWGHVPKTLRNNLNVALTKGMQAGETVQELRQRVGDTFGIAASSAKTLTVARTESAGSMNEIRNAMFTEQGIKKLLWSTAGDEHVRDSHVRYGKAAAKAMGFNYLSIVGRDADGMLAFPNDRRAPPGEVISCRCVHIPVS